MEKVHYENFGVLVCCSGNAVMKIECLKSLVDDMQKMGYNLLELCMEDIYKMDDDPYFGYLRGGYTKAEIRDLEEYAIARGVRVVPCIQTLAHLDKLLKQPHYAEVVDIGGILLIDEPKTYELIEKMFKTMREYFRTDLINIGMDEAHMVGLGRYLDKHGYTNRYELLLKHLHRVVEIAKKYGFKPHMWSDMFFRLAYQGDYYPENPQIGQEIIDKVPEGVGLCYWDYGEHEIKEDIFEGMFRAHNQFGREVWFAGGAWCWNGFAPFNRFSLYSMEPAMRQAKKYGVKNVLITLWTDDGNECPFAAVLPSLYAIRQYADGNFDEAKIAEGFKATFGVDFYDFMLLDLPNKTSRNHNFLVRENASKSLFYNDCFLGFEDEPLTHVDHIPFGEYAKTLCQAGARMGKYQYLFDYLASLCSALEIKAELGIRTRSAYKNGNKAALRLLVDDYEECAKRVEVFGKKFKKIWLGNNKPFGWELQSVRFAGLTARLRDCRERLIAYLNGEEESIPELEEEILPYVPEWGLNFNSWRGLISQN